MEAILKKLIGRRIDVYCTSSIVFRGRVESAEDVLRLIDDDNRSYSIDIQKVVAVSETADSSTRPGFLT